MSFQAGVGFEGKGIGGFAGGSFGISEPSFSLLAAIEGASEKIDGTRYYGSIGLNLTAQFGDRKDTFDAIAPNRPGQYLLGWNRTENVPEYSGSRYSGGINNNGTRGDWIHLPSTLDPMNATASVPMTAAAANSAAEGRMPRDLEGMNFYWLVSEKLKSVFEAIDPEAFAFVACDFTLPDGSKGPQFYLCDVVREVDALDETNSEIQIRFDGGVKIYSFYGDLKFRFKEEMLDGKHVFQTPYSSAIFFDDILRSSCIEAGAKGIWFEKIKSL